MDKEIGLAATFLYLRQNWFAPNVGIVAAGWFQDCGEPAFATSTMPRPGVWRHAEANLLALLAERRDYGVDLSSGYVALTLSPCVKPSRTREGIDCVRRLRAAGVRCAHVGIVDAFQVDNDPSVYKRLGISVTLTRDRQLAGIGERLRSLFERYGGRINDNLAGVKREVGLQCFQDWRPAPAIGDLISTCCTSALRQLV